MNSKIVLAALSLAIALSSAPVAMAGGKKETADPRQSMISLKKKSPGGWQSWCDIDASCNGWGQALNMAKAFGPPTPDRCHRQSPGARALRDFSFQRQPHLTGIARSA
jgi:hypothetical protein